MSDQHKTGAGSRGPGWAVALLAYVIVVFVLSAGVVARYDPAFAAAGASVAAPGTLALNAIPLTIFVVLLLGLTRRPLFSLGLGLLVAYALYAINAIKLDLLDTPVLPADIVLLAHLGDGGKLLAHYLPRSGWIKPVIALAVLLVALVVERPWRRLRGSRRALLLAATLALGASLVAGTRPWPHVYSADAADFETWSPTKSARKGGLTVTMLRYAWSMNFALPEADHAAALRVVSSHPMAPVKDDPNATLPDIIVLQSESFFDPARLRGLQPDQLLPDFRRLAAVSRHGDLWVPTYGGGTIRTEFEVLTGIAMRYFMPVQYPYFRLTAKAIPSLASVLADKGYQTIAVHPHARAFWNRASALAHMGFASFDAVEDFGKAERVGYYISDDALVDHMLARLDAAHGPVFLFAISMENHGPYANFPNADASRLAGQPLPAGLSSDEADRLRGYLYHLEDADRALGRLADALQKRPRRSLLLFYGDHLPALPRIYDRVGFDDAATPYEEPVPWLLFDTAHAAVAPASEATAAFYLPALLLDSAGIDDDGYFHLLESLRREDRPARNWTPADDDGLRAIMLLRQQGAFGALQKK